MGSRRAVSLQDFIFVFLLQISSLVHGDYEVIRKRRQQPVNMPQITDLDVTCEKTGMTVDLRFSAPFNGVIFSKGHFNNPACRYLESGQGVTRSSFEIPMSDCGTSVFEEEASNAVDKSELKTGYSNIIIVQMEADVQEVWDSARKINCEWTNLIRKHVEFQPFEVQMLDFEEVKFEGDSVDCFMDLQVGRYPDSEDITDAVRIGEPLSLLVYAQDDAGMYDMHVKECYAYSSDQYDNSETVKLQLTDARGCVMKNKLLQGFYLAREPTEDGGSKIVAYGYLSAFKFPDVFDVFTTCEVEICKGGCNDKCPDAPPQESDRSLPQSLTETTTEPFIEGVELFGQPISCNDPDTARIDPRCRKPKNLELEVDCENDPFNPDCPPDCLRFKEDDRCRPDCDLDPFNPDCPADCVKFSGEDPRCPVDCNKTPMHAKCPTDCRRFTGKDDRCPCSANPTHPNCPPDCVNFRDKDPRCPPDCQKTPFNPRCPADCSRFAGQDPRCPCSENPLSDNCPPDCAKFDAVDPRCKPDCGQEPFHPQCPPDCDTYTGSDPRCPCSANPRHPACPPDCLADREDPRCPPDCDRDPLNVKCPADCERFAGRDPRCPCSKFPLHPSCPPDCAKYLGKDPRCPPDCRVTPFHAKCEPDCEKFTGEDPRCPCSKYPLHKNCPPKCKLFTGKDPRCPCSKNPFHFNCPKNCEKNTGKDPRCPCSKDPLNKMCPPDCQRFADRDPRCGPNCRLDPLNPACPPDCRRFGGRDPRCPPDCANQPEDERCKDPCDEDPRAPECEGVELFGQPGALSTTTTTTTTTTVELSSAAALAQPATTTRKPRRKTTTALPRGGREHSEEHGHHHHHHHGVDPRFHPFHSFHYDPGDGRRGRGNRIGRSTVRLHKRSIDFEPMSAQKQQLGRARLARHIQVISANETGLPQSLDFQAQGSSLICLTQESFLSGLIVLLCLLFVILIMLIVYCLRDRRRHHHQHEAREAQCRKIFLQN